MKAYNIGDCIRQLREEQNVNQEDLCRGLWQQVHPVPHRAGLPCAIDGNSCLAAAAAGRE